MAAQWSECLSQLPKPTTPNAHVSRAEPVTLTQDNLAAHVEKVGDDPAGTKSLSSKESVLSIQPKSPIKTRTCGISVCNYEGTVSSVLSRSILILDDEITVYFPNHSTQWIHHGYGIRPGAKIFLRNVHPIINRSP
eukprot:930584_1